MMITILKHCITTRYFLFNIALTWLAINIIDISDVYAAQKSTPSAQLTSKPQGDYVVILHGIARSSSHMQSLSEYLAQNGFEVLNLDYPSTDYRLSQLVDHVAHEVGKQNEQDKPIHFVGYSMGGLVVRGLLNKYRPKNLGRVVQLASPNKGSEVADWLKENWLYQTVYGPAGQQLVTNENGLKDLLGKVDYELGIIAGKSSIDPISSFIIPGEDDGKVSIESTKVDGMKAHIIVNAAHTFFPDSRIVQVQTLHFLQKGYFLPNTQ